MNLKEGLVAVLLVCAASESQAQESPAYHRQKAAEYRAAAAAENAKAPNSGQATYHRQAAQAYLNAAAQHEAKAGGGTGGPAPRIDSNVFTSPEAVRAQQTQKLLDNVSEIFRNKFEREERQEQSRREMERQQKEDQRRQEELNSKLQRDALFDKESSFEAQLRRLGTAAPAPAAKATTPPPPAPSRKDPVDADWLVGSASGRNPAGDKLGDILDGLLTDPKQLGRAPLDNLPPPKQPGEKGEWRSKPGLQVTLTGCDFLYQHADVYASFRDASGKLNPSGPYLHIENTSKKPFYFTSQATGHAVNMIVAPGETYKILVSIYRDKVQSEAPLVVDLNAIFWHATP